MEYLSIIWEWLDQQFKPVIVLSASIFTVFFALKKIGNKVNVTYTVTSGAISSPDNMVINGDFYQGDTGFITGYTFVADPNPFGVQSSYSIVTNPNAWFTAFAACGDHTTGNGNMVASV